MDDKQYYRLIRELNSYISDSPVSPVTLSEASPWTGSLSLNMSFESLSNNEKLLAHTLLHRFYPKGNASLSKHDIEYLHAKLKHQINHQDFDNLDKQMIENE